MNRKKVIVFGLGKIYKAFLELYDSSKMDIIALSDNNRKLLESLKSNNKTIVIPEKIVEVQFDFIIVTSSYYEQIANQLKGYGIREDSILNFYNLYQKLDDTVRGSFELINLLNLNISLKKNYKQELERILTVEEKNLFLSAKNFINYIKDRRLDSLEEAEFQVFSQFGEDGIIQWLIHNVAIEQKTFVEFGVENYTEANTRFLLMNNNWSGFVMDGSEDNMNQLNKWNYLWKYDLLATAAFITKDNINQLITDAGYNGDIGLLSIDLDGNDYWILNAINCVSPRILVCEYNSIYGQEEKVCVPYDKKFVRSKAHYSNLYWGASIAAFCDWAENNNYYYMGSNSAGNNAFFARKDCISADKIPKNANIFVESKYRESRDKNGKLSYKRGRERLECVKEMPLFNISTGCLETIEHIYNM